MAEDQRDQLQATRIGVMEPLAATRAGDWYRWLRFGPIIKDGHKRELTPELAAKFRLPPWKPPIKLGDHGDRTAAGGFIVDWQVRDDGIYVLPEYTDKGARAHEEGDYRYHSPEVVWDGELEDATTGDPIEGPFIWGDALLHTPHLGEDAAFFSTEISSGIGGSNMTDTVQVPLSFWDKIVGRLFPDEEPEPEAPAPVEMDAGGPDADEYAAAVAERDKYAAEIEAMKAEQNKAERVAHFASELKETTLADMSEVHERLAALSAEDAEWVLTQFKALSEQANASDLFGERGDTGAEAPGDPQAALNQAIKETMDEFKIDYTSAVSKLAKEQPQLLKAVGYRTAEDVKQG